MTALTAAEANGLLWALAVTGAGAAIGAVVRRDRRRCSTTCLLDRGHQGSCTR